MNARVLLPRLGWLRLRQSREIQGELRNATVTRQGNRWFVSIQTRSPAVMPAAGLEPTLGVDLGVTVFAATSEGSLVAPLNATKRQQRRLRRYQRAVARKKIGGRNRKTAVKRLAALHRSIASQRNDWLHKLTTELADAHPVIAIEDLRVAAMSATAKGTAAKPGKNVRGKAGLNKAILDQGWGQFARLLEYKLASRGGELVKVNPAYTSCTCRVCGHLSADNRKSQALFFCAACDHAEHADVHASKNILTAGRAAWAVRTAEGRASGQPETAACEEDVRHLSCASVKGAASKARGLAPAGQAQEPTETTVRGRAPCVAR
ncbi:transposase [Variovorax paradoxus]|nr:transposase [Variovorax paradoxus]